MTGNDGAVMVQILNIEQGVVYSFKAKFAEAAPGDIYRFRAGPAYDAAPLIELESGAGIELDGDNFAEIVIDDTLTALLTAPEYKWQLDLISGGEVIKRLPGIIQTDGTFKDA